MAVRLPVVLAQSSGGSTARQSLEADAVMRLITAPGIDVSLVGPLDSGSLSGTDRLVFESQERDFVLVSHHSADDAIDELQAMGIGGRRAVHPHDQEASAGEGRRVYCFRWSDFSDSEILEQALVQLHQGAQVVAVPIQFPGTVKKASVSTSETPNAAIRQNSPAPPPPASQPSVKKELTEDSGQQNTSDTDLDRLVADLNDLDF